MTPKEQRRIEGSIATIRKHSFGLLHSLQHNTSIAFAPQGTPQRELRDRLLLSLRQISNELGYMENSVRSHMEQHGKP